MFRYSGTRDKFLQYCSSPETGFTITKGDEDDVVMVGFSVKSEALLALQDAQYDEDFPDLQVGPGSRI